MEITTASAASNSGDKRLLLHILRRPSTPIIPFQAPVFLNRPGGHREEAEGVKDPIAARKVQKSDREKLRRDRLNEHFLELGHTLDPDIPEDDKATILTGTTQMLRDLTAEVNRLKAECAALTEESREVNITFNK